MHVEMATLRDKVLALKFLALYGVCAHMDMVMLNVHLFVVE